ncbi:MAG TPA: phosphate ABC transporter substrate-binding/OmpA family protein [Blastocatellia bacterium]|nr:phosphate ABC transporter substrate-binding/OmpA family protein [Blastocatellia bacterium]
MKLTPFAKLFIAVVVLGVIGLAAWRYEGDSIRRLVGGKSGSGGLDQTTSGSSKNGDAILRLHGSNTLGSKLVPALAEEFLKRQGATGVRTTPGAAADEFLVRGSLPGDSTPETIEIEAHGSATAFADLANGSCDIGLASRKIDPGEIRSLSSLGDMTSPACEHILGLDGIAVIVNQQNPIQELTREQLGKMFSGEITSWTQVLSPSGPINLYARDDKSGTYESFKALVLAGAQLSGRAKRFEDSTALSDAVAADPNGIGFVALPYVISSKAIAVSDGSATPLIPTRTTVASEDYILSRRLFLYTAANPQNSYARKFVDFALSKTGQDMVADGGFVAQNVKAETEAVAPGAPGQYRSLTDGAQRLSLDFRFRTGSTDLDNKALVDLTRVIDFASDLKYSGRNFLLFGFADNVGGAAANIALSTERARVVAEQFKRRGLDPGMVTGFGSELPVASNDTEEGKEKNRRVEVWVRK